jgi:hypothetical protein
MKSRSSGFNFRTVLRTCTAVFILIVLICVQAPLSFSQVPDTSKYGVRIVYPMDDQRAPVGEHAIFGTASHNATATDCTVYVDLNDLEPMQKVMSAGPNYRWVEQTMTIQLRFLLIQEDTI